MPDVPASLEEPEALVSSFRGGGRLLGFRAVQFLFLFGLNLVATRALGPSGRGQYALALNLATVVWVISHFSAEQSIARMLARREASAEELSRLGSFLTLTLGLLGTALALALGLALRDQLLGGAAPATVVLAAATIPFTLAGQLATALLLRLGCLRPYGWIIAAGAVLQLALVVAIETGTGLSPQSAMAAALATIALTAIALAAALARRLGSRALLPQARGDLLRSSFQIGIQLQPSSIALWLNLKIDLLLVGLLTSAHQAGLYSLSANLADIVFVSVSTIGLAALERQTAAGTREAIFFTSRFIGQNLLLAAVLALAGAAVSYPFVVLVYGSAWQGSVLPFALLMPAVVALAVEDPARNMLMRIAPPLSISAASSVAVVLNIALNLALIPAIGIAGASIASVLSYWAAGVLMLVLLSHYGNVPMKRAVLPPQPRHLLSRLRRRGGAVVD
ncbi:MAG TPA: lipopolysaccharide biosynthesis protein [Solirubrobacterales bacterium]|nr:lipopolysaccharide biosynthesis protein [Solirubrobacterales bacterium]